MSELQRALRTRDLFALTVNGVIGSGIFFMPGLIAELLGPLSLVVVLLCVALAFLLSLCFAEAASYFTGTGGPYLYARTAFGPFVGFQVGWMTVVLRIISWSASLSALAVAAAFIFPVFASGWPRAALIVGVTLFLVITNVRGVRSGARLATGVTVIKLAALVLFVGIGLFAIDLEKMQPLTPKGWGGFGESVLLFFYACVGFEWTTIPAGETRDPKRSVARALLSAMVIICLLYLAVQSIVLGTVTEFAGEQNAVALSASTFLGSQGAFLVACLVLVSLLGFVSSQAVIVPRSLYALAEQGELPPWLSRVHPVFQTPANAIWVSAALALAIFFSGSFKELALLSVIARFAQYIPTCLALPRLRKMHPTHEGFRLPSVIPILAIGLCVAFLIGAKPKQLFMGMAAALLGIPLYYGMRAWGRRQQITQLDESQNQDEVRAV